MRRLPSPQQSGDTLTVARRASILRQMAELSLTPIAVFGHRRKWPKISRSSSILILRATVRNPDTDPAKIRLWKISVMLRAKMPEKMPISRKMRTSVRERRHNRGDRVVREDCCAEDGEETHCLLFFLLRARCRTATKTMLMTC